MIFVLKPTQGNIIIHLRQKNKSLTTENTSLMNENKALIQERNKLIDQIRLLQHPKGKVDMCSYSMLLSVHNIRT